MERADIYVMRIEYDPSGIFSKGARIPYSEFLTGLKMGSYPEGMRVTKLAAVSDFKVGVSELGAWVLIDNNDVVWYAIGNNRNRNFIQARRKVAQA